jgi:DNA-binding transcriptional LysR family regulator
VLDGAATLGVVSPLGLRDELEHRSLSPIQMVTAVSPTHPLAERAGLIETRELADCVQIVLSERRDVGVPDQAVLSPRTWRVTDLHAKRAMLLAGVGWGNLPEHFVRDDLARNALVRIRPAVWGANGLTLTLSIVYRRDMTFGRAHRWLLAHLESLCLG